MSALSDIYFKKKYEPQVSYDCIFTYATFIRTAIDFYQ